MPHHRGVVHDLVERQQAEVDGHDLDDGTHPTERRADPGSNERRLGQGRVAYPVLSKFLEQAFADRVWTSVATDIFAHEEHTRVFPKKRLKCRANGVPVRRHDKSLA
jgi:hypothetical protein